MITWLCLVARRGSCAALPVASTPSPAARAGDSKMTLRWEEGHVMSVGDVEIYSKYGKGLVNALEWSSVGAGAGVMSVGDVEMM